MTKCWWILSSQTLYSFITSVIYHILYTIYIIFYILKLSLLSHPIFPILFFPKKTFINAMNGVDKISPMIVFTCQDRLQIHRKRSVNVENDRFSEFGRVFRSPISKVLWQRLRMVKTVVFFISPTRYLETMFSLLPRRRTLQRNMFQFEWVNNKRTDSLAKTKRKETWN